MTISSDGKISGSLFNFNDGSTDTVTGTVDLTTGNGSVKVTNSKGGNTDSYNITLKTTTRKYSFMEGTYDKVGSSSKGIFFGLKKTD